MRPKNWIGFPPKPLGMHTSPGTVGGVTLIGGMVGQLWALANRRRDARR
jgi:hypothetical protein